MIPDLPSLVRVCLFTDTLADVNGVSRFIQNIAHQAAAAARDLTVVTSTRLSLPDAPNVLNLPPTFASRMPRYEQLELAIPAPGAARRVLGRLRPDAVHISTPGPVGLAGRLAARRLRIPILGTYHTDFPAYIEHLFDDLCLRWVTSGAMRWFYRPFDAVFTRSREYADAVASLGVRRHRIIPLLPGIDTDLFRPDHRDDDLWARHDVPRNAVKVLSVGRVSVEKNLPLLARAWAVARRACLAANIDARLIVVGDGPYRPTMQQELAGAGAHFLGFRHGRELASLYASADFFVFPSATDTLGQVVMEAHACGLPALVSDIGGPRGVIIDGATGHILPASNPRAWSRAIESLVRDEHRRRAMGAAAHQSMRPRSIRASFDHFWSVHESAVNARTPHPAPIAQPASCMPRPAAPSPSPS